MRVCRVWRWVHICVQNERVGQNVPPLSVHVPHATFSALRRSPSAHWVHVVAELHSAHPLRHAVVCGAYVKVGVSQYASVLSVKVGLCLCAKRACVAECA